MSRNITKHLGDLVSKGTLDQYFSIDEDNINELMSALSGDSEDVSTILHDNLLPGGMGLVPIFQGMYNTQFEELGGRFVSEHFKNLEAENVRLINSFNRLDFTEKKKVNKFITTLREQIEKIEELPTLKGFIQRRNNMLGQLIEAEEQLSTPEDIKSVAVEIVKERKKDPEDIRTTKVIENWGRGHRRALVTWGSRGILAVKFLDKPVKKPKKPKLEYIPTRPQFREKTPEQILSRKGKEFTIKEISFVQRRKNKSKDEVFEDYNRIFGKIRTKTEINKLIKDY